MTLKLHHKFGIALVILLAFVILIAVASDLLSGVKVVVINEGAKTITNLTISYRGGSLTLPRLDGENFHEFKVRPEGKTDLIISFTDTNGKVHGKTIDIYLAKNIGGTLTIKIDSSGEVKWVDATTVSYF
jgi:hypothetical protein